MKDAHGMEQPTHLIVELDAAADPVHGTIGPSNGNATPFSGYVQLIAAIERLRKGEGAGEFAEGAGRGYRGERDPVA